MNSTLEHKIASMTANELQALCERGQQELMRMEYLDAEATLAQAEKYAFEEEDWDTLSRLYLPLQEARRQKRQRCADGIVCLDLIAEEAEAPIDPRHVVENFPHGQLLVAGWGTTAPAAGVRKLAERHKLFLETFLAAAFPLHSGRVVAIVPIAESALPDTTPRTSDELLALLPPHSFLLNESELPTGRQRGTVQTAERIFALWERLHAPFLGDADRQTDPILKIEGYRQTIRVDYACELAHQKLAAVARTLR